ncbi:MAG: GNAT family N-acetyltransferase [Thermoguttaceae bacterium]|nr:GNAT family N-acetyltransferase [Thermoguttaceae bacterium]
MTREELQAILPDASLNVGTPDDANDCLSLRAETTRELERRGTARLCLARESAEEFRAFFDDDESRALVLRTPTGELVGFGIATYRGESLQKFRPLIPDFDASLHNVVYIKLIQIAPKFRGHGLQRLFFRELEAWALEQGASYATGTVSPENVPSVENFLRCGYKEAERFVHDPTGYERIRMIKKIVKQ